MKEIHDMDIYQLAEQLSDRVWDASRSYKAIIDELGPKLNAFIRSTT